MLLQSEAPKRRRCKPPLPALVRPSHADSRRLKEEVAVQVTSLVCGIHSHHVRMSAFRNGSVSFLGLNGKEDRAS